MEANELRVTNIVRFVEENINDEIGHHNLGILLAYPSSDKYEPIPLTEEWLLKFGFNGWDKGNYTMILSNGNFFEFGNIIAQNIKYVHQLQNLYFVLVGEELSIMPKID